MLQKIKSVSCGLGRRTISILICVLILAGSFQGFTKASTTSVIPNEEENKTINLELTFPCPEITRNGEYYQVLMDNVESFALPGEPTLPFKTVKILIPMNYEVASIDVQPLSDCPLSGNYILMPGQMPVPLLNTNSIPGQTTDELPYQSNEQNEPSMTDPYLIWKNQQSQFDEASNTHLQQSSFFTAPNDFVYNTTIPFPTNIFKSLGVQSVRGFKILMLNIYPVSYIPKFGLITYYPQIKVEIETTKMMDQTETGSHLSRNLQSDRSLVEKLVDNPKTLASYQNSAIGRGVSPEKPSSIVNPADTYQYVIITNSALLTSSGTYTFQDLVERKNLKGIPATIVTVEDIVADATYDGVDTQEEIRNFIIDAYLNWETEYVLLGGDGDGGDVGGESGDAIVPHRGFYANAYGVIDTDIPADLYYSCLDGNFNYDGDSWYGEATDGPSGGEVDLLAEVYVGRAPVDTDAELSNFIMKTFAYEDAVSGYLEDVLMLGELLWPDPTWGCDYKDEIKNGSWANPPIPSDYNVTTLYDRDMYPDEWDKTDLIPLINNGVHIINHLGHSNVNYCMRLYNSDVDTQFNNTDFFFGYSQGCYDGSFDNRDVSGSYTSYDCISEHLVDNPNGAFAFIGNSRYGWGHHGDTNGSSQYFDRKFFDALFGQNIRQLGCANQYSKEQNIGIINDEAIRWCYYELTLFGDPEISIKDPTPPDHEIAVTSLAVDKYQIPNDNIFVNATVLNQGLSNETNIQVNFTVDAAVVNTSTISFLEAGTAVQVSFPWTTPITEGAYLIGIETTPVTWENITTNNRKEKETIVGPDIAVTAINVVETVNVFETVYVNTTVENLGKINVSNVTVELNISGCVIASMNISSLTSGMIEQIQFEWTPWVTGTQPVKVVAIPVMNEPFVTNNEMSKSVLVTHIIYYEDVESGVNGWTAGGLWHISTARSAPTAQLSPTHSWCYNDGVDYDTGSANSGSVTSPLINVSWCSEAILRFKGWYETESTSSTWDQRWVHISTNGGAFQQVAQLYGDPMNNWNDYELNITGFLGNSIQIRFYFNTVDGIANNYEGWYIDDVTILGNLLEHDIAVTNLTAPDWLQPFDTSYINATIFNNGMNNETEITVNFKVNGAVEDSIIIPPSSSSPTSISVLLVDADAYNDGLVYYYIWPLQNNSANVTVWDVYGNNGPVQGKPTAADMAPFDAVIWTPSRDMTFGDELDAVDEGEIAAYLNDGSGHNFLLSNTFYSYVTDGGSTSYSIGDFAYDYLGMAGVSTMSFYEITVEGAVSDAVFNGFGPATLDWTRCNWGGGGLCECDELVASLGTSCMLNDGFVENGIRYDSGSFKTMFMGFPFETLQPSDADEFMNRTIQWFSALTTQPILEPGDTYPVSFEWTPIAQGNYTVAIETLPVANETFLSNNIQEKNVLVTYYPDIWIDPTDFNFIVEAGDIDTKNLTVGNAGLADLSYDILYTGQPNQEYALSFDGNDYITVNDNSSLDGTGVGSTMSWSFWIKPNSSANYRTIIDKGEPTAGYLITMETNGDLEVYLDTGGPPFVSNTNIVNNIWSHIVVVANGTYIKCYKNGTFIDSTPYSSITSNALNLRVGTRLGTPREFYMGTLEEVKIYKRALSEAEILDLYQLQPISESQLAAYWQFNEGIGTTTYDGSINANDGSITGATWATSFIVTNVTTDWLSVSPLNGSLIPSNEIIHTVTANATTLEPGVYSTSFSINSNDPDEPEVVVPVNLTVLSAPHDIRILNMTVEGPSEAGKPLWINGTILNQGIENETDVEVQLLVDFGFENSTIIPSLLSAQQDLISFEWVPPLGTQYNLSLYVVPVPGEDITYNNWWNETVDVFALPDIWVNPLAYDFTLQAGQIDSDILTIGNEGLGILFFNLTKPAKEGPFNIFWYDDFEESSYSGSIREYLESQGHTVTYQSDSSGYIDTTTLIPTHDVIIAEHTCGSGTLINLNQWFAVGKGYIALLGLSMYNDPPEDDYIMNLLGVGENGNSGSGWTPAGLNWVDTSHPIANIPNTGWSINGIPSGQYQYYVNIISGSNVITGPSGVVLQTRENVESKGRIVYWGSNYHTTDRTDSEVRKLVENMIFWASNAQPGGGALEDWLSVTPDNGTVAPIDQTDLMVTVNTTTLEPGFYQANITVVSNDPDEPETIVPVNLTVIPPDHDIRVLNIEAPTEMYLGSMTVINATITNQGLLNETNIEIQLKENGVPIEVQYINLDSGNSGFISFDYLPGSAGTFNISIYAVPVPGEIITFNNENFTTIDVVAVPDIWVTPSGYEFVLTAGEVGQDIMTIGNDGYADLCLNISDDLDSLGTGTNPILNPSFETGNFTSWVTQDLALPFYTLSVVGSGIQAWPEFFFSAPTNGSFTAFHGFDGGGPGTIKVAQDMTLPPGTSTLSFDYRAAWDLITYGATQNRIFRVDIEPPGGGTALQSTIVMVATVGTLVEDTGNLHGLVDLSSFAGDSIRISFEWDIPEDYVGPGEFQLDNVVVNYSTAMSEDWLSEFPNSAIVPPSNDTNILIIANATMLDPGFYQANISVASNDPDEPEIIVPVNLTVLPPDHDIKVSNVTAPSQMELGDIGQVNATITNQGLNNEINVEIQLKENGIPIDWTFVNLDSGNSQIVSFDYSPGSAGMFNISICAVPVPGETITFNNENYTIIEVIAVPDIWVTPPNFNVSVVKGGMTNRTLTIGNDGTEVLWFDIIDYTGLPGVGNYTVQDTTYSWIDGVTGGTKLSLTDDSYQTVSLPFTCKFYDGLFTNLHVCSNGWVSFSYASGSIPANISLPDTGWDNTIFALGNDWIPGSGSSGVYVKSLTAPNRYVVTWYQVPHYSTGGLNTFEVILYESGEIVVNYQQLQTLSDIWTVGVNKGDGIYGTKYFTRPANITAIEFKTQSDCPWLYENPTNGTVIPSDALNSMVTFDATSLDVGFYFANISISNNDPEDNPIIIPVVLEVTPPPHDIAVENMDVQTFVRPSGPIPVNATLRNIGTNNEYNVLVNFKVNDGLAGSQTMPFIASGDTEIVTFSWEPGLTGTYILEIEAIPVPGETIINNNNKTATVVAIDAAPILLVDDDLGISSQIWYYNAVVANGYQCNIWNTTLNATPPLDLLKLYGVVIWFTGNDYSSGLNSSERTVISNYLNNSGKMYISGGLIGFDAENNGWLSWYQTWLKASVVDSLVSGTQSQLGITGDPIGDGMTLNVYTGDGCPQLWNYSSTNLAISPGTPSFNFSTYPTNSSMIKVDNGIYKLVYSSFDFAGVNTITTRNTLMYRILNWLGVADVIPPQHSNEHPGIDTSTIDQRPIIWVHVTDNVAVNSSTIRLYVRGFPIMYDLSSIPGGYNVSYLHGADYPEGAVPVRIVARDTSNNLLDFTWVFNIDLSPPIIWDIDPPPNGMTHDTTPTIRLNVTDLSGVNITTMRLYVQDYAIWYEYSIIPGGYHVWYTHEYGFSPGELVRCRMRAEDPLSHCLDYYWNFTITNFIKASIPVHAGWNLISFPVIPNSTALPGALLDADGDTSWDIVQWYDPSDSSDYWKSYSSFKPSQLNDLADINRTMGVWLHIPNGLLGNGYLSIWGQQPAETSILLHAGWNLIGYPSLTPRTASDTLPLQVDIVSVFDNTDPYNVRDVTDLSTITMESGKGYWVHVTSDTIWQVT